MSIVTHKLIKYAQGAIPSSESRKTLTPEVLSELLDRYGDAVGTKHRRIFVPKENLKKGDLVNMGFRFAVGVPEKGGNLIASYKHRDSNLHAHKYKDGWTMHRDELPPSARHLVTEGIPAIYYNMVKAKGRMSDQVKSKTEELLKLLSGSPEAISS